MTVTKELEDSLRYLASDIALSAIDADAYWPKWNGPWWQMLLIHEIGETKRIPAPAIERLVRKMNEYPVKIFPIHPEDMP
ncbi:MAG: hypothetical protein AAB250_03770, partial [Bdellovibrionota bacterium]